MDTTSRPSKKSPDIEAFLVGGIVPDDVKDALAGVAGLYLSQKLCCTDPIDGCGLNKGCVEGFEVQSSMNVYASTPCRAENRRI